MVELRILRKDTAAVLEAYKKRNFNDEQLGLIHEIIQADDSRKALQAQIDQQLAALNLLAKEIGDLFKSGKTDDANVLKQKVNDLKTQSKELELQLEGTKQRIEEKLLMLPNVPNERVPHGITPDDNVVQKLSTEELPQLTETALPHWELARKYNLFDMELGVKLSGSGFIVYRGQGAKLQRALIQFFLDRAVDAGYEEIHAPLLVNSDSARGTGQLPDKEGQMYYVEKDDLYLIPTAEVPITNIYRDEILKDENFSIKLCGYTPCFRREAGSYGAHVKGLNRVHQFDKIEIVRIEHPDRSYEAFEEMIEHVEKLLQALNLPYRILRLCGGDMGFASALTYDFEVYSAAQKRWLEVSSVSNFESFQSNRLKLRYKNAKGESVLTHTLNGSALALARIVAALLENHQTDQGIIIPEALRPYTGFDMIR